MINIIFGICSTSATPLRRDTPVILLAHKMAAASSPPPPAQTAPTGLTTDVSKVAQSPIGVVAGTKTGPCWHNELGGAGRHFTLIEVLQNEFQPDGSVKAVRIGTAEYGKRSIRNVSGDAAKVCASFAPYVG